VDAIAQFLTHPYVVDKDQLQSAPYIVDFAEEHIIGGAGQRAFVRKIEQAEPRQYEIVRPGPPYRDGRTGEILGYEGLYIGASELLQTGDPATVFLNSTKLEAIIGDRLVPASEEKTAATFQPHAPAMPIEGSIISVLGGVSQIGQYNVVVLDRGASDGLDPGSVLRVMHRGETVRDIVSPKPGEMVTLPDEQAGLLMVFRTFDRVSFGLIMYATRAIHVGDLVRNP
jgi:hypothetical protein